MSATGIARLVMALAVTAWAAAAAHAVNDELIITEIMYSTLGDDDGHEFIEIYNNFASAVNLAGYVLDDDDEGPLETANINAGIVAPGTAAVLFDTRGGNTVAAMQSAWGSGVNFIPVSSWSSLGNAASGDRIGLWNSFANYDGGDVGAFLNPVATLTYARQTPWPDVDRNSDEGRSFHLTSLTDPVDPLSWSVSTKGDDGVIRSVRTDAAHELNDVAAVGNPGAVPTGVPTADTLVITEIMYHPPDGGEGEYVEVYNNTGATIDFALTPWWIDNGEDPAAAGVGGNITSGTIPDGAVAVLYNGDETPQWAAEEGWGATINFIAVKNWDDLRLGNGSDRIGLWDNFGDYNGDHITHVKAEFSLAYTDDPPWPADDGNGSVWHTNLGTDPHTGGNWQLSAVPDSISSFHPTQVYEDQWGSPGAVLLDRMPGDLNSDGFVGGADLDIIRSFWGQNVTPGNWLKGDPSGDGFVGGDDLDAVRANWGQGTPPAPAEVPEPSAAMFVVLGVLTLLTTRRPTLLARPG